MQYPHVSDHFWARLVVNRRVVGRSADLAEPTGRIAMFSGLSGKILVMSWERLGDEVRLRRKHLKLTQPEVAERGGLSVATIRAIETNRAGRLSPRLRRALERAIEWEPGTIDTVLEGGGPRPVATTTAPASRPGDQNPAATAERFARARWMLKMRRSFSQHRDGMAASARAALDEEFATAAREMEEALIWMLPWLEDGERAEAIRILAELRDG